MILIYFFLNFLIHEHFDSIIVVSGCRKYYFLCIFYMIHEDLIDELIHDFIPCEFIEPRISVVCSPAEFENY